MADRFFPNLMPGFVAEMPTSSTSLAQQQQHEAGSDSLMRLLSMPYPSLSHHFKRTALDLRETIVSDMRRVAGQREHDFTLYTGALGKAFLLFKAYQVTNNMNDLMLCSQIVRDCDSASLASRDVTFICGRGGVCALGAVAAKLSGDRQLFTYYLSKFKEIKLSRNLPDELLYGRVGFLWACLFLNKHIGEGTIPSFFMRAVVDEIIKNGRALAKKGKSPLMFEWYGEKYWGAAHGLAGIMHVLMDMELKPEEVEDVKGTLRYMIYNRFPSWNYPASEEDRSDVLVHWCHGAPGIALTLVKAAKVFRDQEFLKAAMDAAEVVWNRGLLKRVGICHGISGNTYVFLSLYQLTGNVEYLYKAKAFTCFLLDRAHKLISEGEMHGGDHPYSLFEGIGGMAYLFLDMVEPSEAKFPAYEL
ncbi:lanC-like protein GCL2 [Ziziphus jujuba]|uniref:LanC-like protein GCL2 n=2 Tax=Ziziphus jujuba TaxID=326968 RepID=A0A6P4A0N7_ZIZJJ|nr:lanC-like protein GCL2 [Ziziphus jujuba]KAH7533306.1 hypothetical protein FEM48_Zijuj04G0116700 [Ziziphus jujuba var. spinosa]